MTDGASPETGDLFARVACGIDGSDASVGTVRQEEALHRLVSGRTIGSSSDELALIDEIAQVMRDASICGLGQTAANAVQSAVASLGIFAGVGAPAQGDELPMPTEEQES